MSNPFRFESLRQDVPAGNTYVTGRFAGSGTFGAGESNETVLSSSRAATFAAKYNNDGLLMWVKQLGTDSRDARSAIAADATGNCYVAGCFRGTATLGTGEVNETTLEADSYSILVARYNPTDQLAWAKQAGGDSTDGAYGVAVDAAANCYVTGRFEDVATFGAGETRETVLTSTGATDIFIAKYDANGSLIWATQAGSALSEPRLGDVAHHIAVDASGNSCLVGVFEGTAIFGRGETNQTALVSFGSLDLFIAKYDVDGLLLPHHRLRGKR